MRLLSERQTERFTNLMFVKDFSVVMIACLLSRCCEKHRIWRACQARQEACRTASQRLVLQGMSCWSGWPMRSSQLQPSQISSPALPTVSRGGDGWGRDGMVSVQSLQSNPIQSNPIQVSCITQEVIMTNWYHKAGHGWNNNSIAAPSNLFSHTLAACHSWQVRL